MHKNKNITVSYFGHKRDNHIAITETTTWLEFKNSMLSKHTQVNDKDFLLFNGMKFTNYRSEGFIRRCADNVSWITMLILDYDGKDTIENIKAHFSDYEYAGYTSYSHMTTAKNGKDCFRIVFPLCEPVSIKEYKSRKTALLKWAGDVDQSSTDISRGFYLPSCLHENMNAAQCWCNHGNWLDISTFSKETISEPANNMPTPIEDEKKQLIKDALSEIFLGYEPDWVKVMWAMKNCGYTLQDFIDVTVYGNLMHSKTVNDCKCRWATIANKKTNTGYLINLIRRKGKPEFLKPKTLDLKRYELLDMKNRLEELTRNKGSNKTANKSL